MLDRPQALSGCKPSRSFGASLIGVLSFEVAERNDVHRTRFVLCRSVEWSSTRSRHRSCASSSLAATLKWHDQGSCSRLHLRPSLQSSKSSRRPHQPTSTHLPHVSICSISWRGLLKQDATRGRLSRRCRHLAMSTKQRCLSSYSCRHLANWTNMRVVFRRSNSLHYMKKINGHPQNRKYITYCTTVRERPSHGLR